VEACGCIEFPDAGLRANSVSCARDIGGGGRGEVGAGAELLAGLSPFEVQKPQGNARWFSAVRIPVPARRTVLRRVRIGLSNSGLSAVRCRFGVEPVQAVGRLGKLPAARRSGARRVRPCGIGVRPVSTASH